MIRHIRLFTRHFSSSLHLFTVLVLQLLVRFTSFQHSPPDTVLLSLYSQYVPYPICKKVSATQLPCLYTRILDKDLQLIPSSLRLPYLASLTNFTVLQKCFTCILVRDCFNAFFVQINSAKLRNCDIIISFQYTLYFNTYQVWKASPTAVG